MDYRDARNDFEMRKLLIKTLKPGLTAPYVLEPQGTHGHQKSPSKSPSKWSSRQAPTSTAPPVVVSASTIDVRTPSARHNAAHLMISWARSHAPCADVETDAETDAERRAQPVVCACNYVGVLSGAGPLVCALLNGACGACGAFGWGHCRLIQCPASN